MNAKHLTTVAAFAAVALTGSATLAATPLKATSRPPGQAATQHAAVASMSPASLQVAAPAPEAEAEAGLLNLGLSEFTVPTNACLLLGALAAMVLLARRRGLG